MGYHNIRGEPPNKTSFANAGHLCPLSRSLRLTQGQIVLQTPLDAILVVPDQANPAATLVPIKFLHGLEMAAVEAEAPGFPT
jgi:hypothetical protein